MTRAEAFHATVAAPLLAAFREDPGSQAAAFAAAAAVVTLVRVAGADQGADRETTDSLAQLSARSQDFALVRDLAEGRLDPLPASDVERAGPGSASRLVMLTASGRPVSVASALTGALLAVRRAFPAVARPQHA